ncbi:MAG: murein L,D-transpeptidase catalytic domain family protein [Opitutaceae bacterium]
MTASILFWMAARPGAEAYAAAQARLGKLRADERSSIRGLAVVDYSRPGWHRRLALYDAAGDLVGTYLVAHARNSGDYVTAVSFSNELDSNQSSLGLYRILDLYDGDHGIALRLEGLDPGLNDQAFARDIVIHGADYVSLGSLLENILSGNGAGVGRSLGCPAVSRDAMPIVAEVLAQGGYLYIHH